MSPKTKAGYHPFALSLSVLRVRLESGVCFDTSFDRPQEVGNKNCLPVIFVIRRLETSVERVTSVDIGLSHSPTRHLWPLEMGVALLQSSGNHRVLH